MPDTLTARNCLKGLSLTQNTESCVRVLDSTFLNFDLTSGRKWEVILDKVMGNIIFFYTIYDVPERCSLVTVERPVIVFRHLYLSKPYFPENSFW